MNAEILLQIAEDVLKAPDNGFDMASWECGTTACAIGWHIRFHPECPLKLKKIVWHEGSRMRRALTPTFEGLGDFDALSLYLNIDWFDIVDLFSPDDKLSREAVAARIVQYVRDHSPTEAPVIELKPERQMEVTRHG